MAINKVVYGNNTLIDLSNDTAEASDVAQGKTFHLRSGAQAVGTAQSAAGIVGIDVDNLLATIPRGYNISYTATQDCYMFWTQTNYVAGRELTLNGVALATDNINVVLPLQAGDVVTCGYNGNTVKVFGVK